MEKNNIDLILNNINSLMHRNNVKTPTELSRLTKIPQPTLHKLLTGGVQEPKYTMLKALADALDVSVEDLAERDLTKGYIEENRPKIKTSKAPVTGTVPLIININEKPIATIDFNLARPRNGFVNWPSNDPEVYALRCADDSLMPRIKNGEYIIVEPNRRYSPGDEVLIETNNGTRAINTFLFEKDNILTFISINEDSAPRRLPKSEIVNMQYIAGLAKSALWNEN